jgi:hypothetical protein
MKNDVISEVIAALRSDDSDTRAYAAHYLDEVARTRAGHWHPDFIECSERCPIGDPRTRETFSKILQEA